jgi:hypothetical protein
MTQTEALRLALEALEDLGMKHYENTGEVLYKNTYTAIKVALEAKDEPVAYLPPTASPENACYTPPQRTWVGLTNEEIASVEYNNHPLDGIRSFARAIEAKLKEKNS